MTVVYACEFTNIAAGNHAQFIGDYISINVTVVGYITSCCCYTDITGSGINPAKGNVYCCFVPDIGVIGLGYGSIGHGD